MVVINMRCDQTQGSTRGSASAIWSFFFKYPIETALQTYLQLLAHVKYLSAVLDFWRIFKDFVHFLQIQFKHPAVSVLKQCDICRQSLFLKKNWLIHCCKSLFKWRSLDYKTEKLVLLIKFSHNFCPQTAALSFLSGGSAK